jgi:protein SCO1/2
MVRQRTGRFLFLTFFMIGLCLGREAVAAEKPVYTATLEKFELPDVTLINQEGRKVPLKKLLLSDKPVLVDFVYTTCTTICPILSANFTNFQHELATKAGTFQLVSISIDPENDTPNAMKTYLERYYAKPGWDFLTGSREDIDRVLVAFNAKTQSKMDHYPLIMIKSPSKDRWLRIYGLIGTSELIKEYEGVLK